MFSCVVTGVKFWGCAKCRKPLPDDYEYRLEFAMLEAAEEFATTQAKDIIATASRTMGTQLQAELDRLISLRKVNDHVRPEEIELTRTQFTELTTALAQARLRLDAVRLIWKGDPAAIRG